MKKSTLLEVIKKVVKREVRSAIKEELNKKQPSDKPEFNQMMEHADGLFNTEKQSFAKDPILNEVLNETAATPKDQWKTMGGKTLNTSDGRAGLASMMGMESPEQMFGGKPSAKQMLPDDRKHVQIDDELAGVLTRDYSGLMKAIDKKKK